MCSELCSELPPCHPDQTSREPGHLLVGAARSEAFLLHRNNILLTQITRALQSFQERTTTSPLPSRQ